MAEFDTPPLAAFFGNMGTTMAIVLCTFGAAFGTAKSGSSIAMTGIMNSEVVMKCILPVIMAGIIAIYGLILSVLINGNVTITNYTEFRAFTDLGAGISTGVCGLSAGLCIGYVGEAGVRAIGQRPALFTGLVLILIFAEVLALYGVIMGLLMVTKRA